MCATDSLEIVEERGTVFEAACVAAAAMRYYLYFTIAGLSLIGGVVACANAFATGNSWELVVLAAVFFCFSSIHLTLLEIRDGVRSAAERERLKSETLNEAEPMVLRVGPEPQNDEPPRRQA